MIFWVRGSYKLNTQIMLKKFPCTARTSTTYAQITWPSRRPFHVPGARSPLPIPLRNWCRISSSVITGAIPNRCIYRVNNSPTCAMSRSSISRSPAELRARCGIPGSLFERIKRASVKCLGIYVNLTSTSFGTLRDRWKYLARVR